MTTNKVVHYALEGKTPEQIDAIVEGLGKMQSAVQVQEIDISNVEAHGHDFGWALQKMRDGNRVARREWNGKGMFLFLVSGSTFTVNREPLNSVFPEGTRIQYHPHVDMYTAQKDVVPWLCSQTDMLAFDWVLAE